MSWLEAVHCLIILFRTTHPLCPKTESMLGLSCDVKWNWKDPRVPLVWEIHVLFKCLWGWCFVVSKRVSFVQLKIDKRLFLDHSHKPNSIHSIMMASQISQILGFHGNVPTWLLTYHLETTTFVKGGLWGQRKLECHFGQRCFTSHGLLHSRYTWIASALKHRSTQWDHLAVTLSPTVLWFHYTSTSACLMTILSYIDIWRHILHPCCTWRVYYGILCILQ